MLRAIIFDFDGVVVDSEPLHLEAIKAALGDAGAALTPELYAQRYLAYDDLTGFALFFADRGMNLTEEELRAVVTRKGEIYMEMIRTGKVRFFPGVAGLIRELARTTPLAIATGSLRHEVSAILAAGGLLSCFKVVVSAEDVSRGKPDPESYLLALAELNRVTGTLPAIMPGEALVIEDSRRGIASSHRAGMKALAVSTSYPACELGEADLILPSLAGLQLSALAKLFPD